MPYKNLCRLVTLLLLIALIPILLTACKDNPPPPEPEPSGISAVNGDIYKAVMGTAQTDNPIEFIVRNDKGNPIQGQWVYFTRLIGDGTFVADSLITDASGKVTCQYTFDSTLGNAIISAIVRDIDTVMVEIRANTMIPGTTGQGQYILMQDEYSDVIEWLGTPSAIDIDPNVWLLYADYEAALGVVIMIEDINHDSTVVDTAGVYGVIVNSVYDVKTKDSIGIGSTRAQFSAAYGVVPGMYDPTPPPAYYYFYPNEGLTFWTDTIPNEGDRVTFEIHLTENVTPPPPTFKKANEYIQAVAKPVQSIYRIRQ